VGSCNGFSVWAVGREFGHPEKPGTYASSFLRP
jgi:hypothetical protein